MKVRPIVNESTIDCPMCGASPHNAHRERDCFSMIQWAAAVPDLPPAWNEREAEIALAASEILKDLKDRKGFRQTIDEIDEDVIADEILPAWRSIIRSSISGER